MTAIITTTGLTKHYGKSRGIQDVAVTVDEGEVFGFLGPNGAGKTTMIRVLMGLLQPTAGTATIGGLDCWTASTAVKRQVGYLPGELAVDPNLTGAQILAYLGHLRGGVDQASVAQFVKRLDLDTSKRFREYSRGNKQKVGLIQAFMHRPRLLILDEPTGGLDPLNQQEFYTMIDEVHADGRTVFLSSHILPEIERTCTRVGIIREGLLIRVDAVSALKDIRHHVMDISFADTASSVWFSALPGVVSAESANADHDIKLTVQGDLTQVITTAAQHHATNITTHEPSLEEIFLRFYAPTVPSK